MITIEIGNKKYKVQEAHTEEEKEKGLQGVTELPEDKGMLFYFDPPEDVSMWMKGTSIPLDIIFINDDEEVTYVHKGEPNNEKLITVVNTAYVLEVNADSGIKEGDELDFEDNEDTPVMKVLAQDGSTQMNLWGGERIFRRAFTKQLIKWAKRAEDTKEDKEKFNKICIRLGKKMFKEIKAQDNRPAEYVQSPK